MADDLGLRRFFDLGLRMFAAIAVFTLLGFKVDQWLDTSPIFLIVGAFLGVTGGMISVVSAVGGLGASPPRDDPGTPPRDRPSAGEESDDPA